MPTAVKIGSENGKEAGSDNIDGSGSTTRPMVDGDHSESDGEGNNGNHKSQEVAGSGPPVTRNDYERMKRELKELLSKKRSLDKNLTLIEDHLYNAETAYLEDTPNGNIVRGFDNYIKGTGSGSRRRTGGISEADRIFSGSSISLNRSKRDLVDLDNTKPDS